MQPGARGDWLLSISPIHPSSQASIQPTREPLPSPAHHRPPTHLRRQLVFVEPRRLHLNKPNRIALHGAQGSFQLGDGVAALRAACRQAGRGGVGAGVGLRPGVGVSGSEATLAGSMHASRGSVTATGRQLQDTRSSTSSNASAPARAAIARISSSSSAAAAAAAAAASRPPAAAAAAPAPAAPPEGRSLEVAAPPAPPAVA